MGVSKVAVVYSKNQEVVRRVIHFDRICDPSVERGWRLMTPEELSQVDEEKEILKHKAYCHDLEALDTIDHQTYHSFSHPAHVHQHLKLKGVPGVDDRHAVVDKDDNVVAVVLCDSDIDRHDKHKYVKHADAKVGDKLVLPKGNP